MNELAGSAADSATIEVPLLIDGEWRTGTRFFDSIDPYRGGVVSRAPETTGAELDATLDAARRGATEIAAMPGYERAALLRRVGEILVERADDIGRVMARETGKAIKDARAEVRRS
ncbi:MAG: aldehyde dehydrogenase family protein, partial [Alphaproteobacteria bacterium]